MEVILAKNWWSLVIRGLVAFVLGSFTAIRPDLTVSDLALAFFAYVLIDGLVGLAGALRAAESHQRWGALLLEGITGVAIAIITIALPNITPFELICVIALWALLTGFFELLAAVRLRRYVAGEWLFAVSGLASITLGVLMILLPLSSPLPIGRLIGAYAFVFGALLIGLGIRLRVVPVNEQRLA